MGPLFVWGLGGRVLCSILTALLQSMFLLQNGKQSLLVYSIQNAAAGERTNRWYPCKCDLYSLCCLAAIL